MNPALRTVNEWLTLLDDGAITIRKALTTAYGDPELLDPALALLRRCLVEFGRGFGADRAVFVVRSTGRVNLLGMHVDHRGGSVNPIAIKEAFFVVEPRADDVVVVRDVESAKFPEESFAIRDCLPAAKPIDDWEKWCHGELEKRRGDSRITFSNYIRAAVLYFQHLHTGPDGSFAPAFKGMNMLIGSNVPRAAGLSTSSCLVVAAGEAILRVNGLAMDPMKFCEHCGKAEWYVGTRGGFGDHAAIRMGQCNSIVHMTSFPFSLKVVPFPPGYRVVIADSLVEAKKQGGAKDGYNTPLAAYAFGLWLARKRWPAYASRMEHLRDIAPAKLGVGEDQIYRIIRSLPERATRAEVLKQLPDHAEAIANIFRSHNEPTDGYRIRGVCMYGIAECLRSNLAVDLLRKDDIVGFGRLMTLHHDGDRVARLRNGAMIPETKEYSDVRMDQLISDAQSRDPSIREQARLWAQPGAYNVSVPEIDQLVDLTLQVDGAMGAGLVGAGLGGSMVALVKSDSASAVVEKLAEYYYKPRGLPVRAEIVAPVGGAGILQV